MDYPGGPKSRRGRKKRENQRGGSVRAFDLMLLALKMEEGKHGPRKAGSF